MNRTLLDLDFLRERTNVVLIGSSGVALPTTPGRAIMTPIRAITIPIYAIPMDQSR